MQIVGCKLCYGIKGTAVTWDWSWNAQGEEDSVCISDWLWVITKNKKKPRFTEGRTGGLLSNHQYIYFTGYGVTISESAVFPSSLEKPERSQYSMCQSTLEPFISTLCTYLEEKKITHKHKHITAGRVSTSSCTTLAQPPTCLSHCTLGRTLCALGGSWDRAIPFGLCTRQLHWIFSDLSSPLRVLLSVVHCWCKLQPKKKWQVPEIHFFLLLLPLPSSPFCFDLLPFTISSPYISGCSMVRFHPDTTFWANPIWS